MALVLALGVAPPVSQAAPLPTKVFSAPPAISNVQISRDGKHIVALTSSNGQSPTISVWASASGLLRVTRTSLDIGKNKGAEKILCASEGFGNYADFRSRKPGRP